MNDGAFLDAFLRAEIPHAEWTHRAHLRVAFAMIRREPDHERAMSAMREGITRLNAAHEQGGVYLEDVTDFWMRTIRAASDASPGCSTFDEFIASHGAFLDKRYTPGS